MHSEGDQPMRPEYRDRDRRLALMDAQGVEAALLLPSLGVTLEHFMKEDVEQTCANLRAFNRWLDEDWGFAYRGRIFAVPLLSLLDLDWAIAELEWLLARGARAVHLRPGPQAGRSPADLAFDPFWARIDEAGVAGRVPQLGVGLQRAVLDGLGRGSQSPPATNSRPGSG